MKRETKTIGTNMNTYHKIKTLWKREDTKPHNMMVGVYAEIEFELLKDIDWVATEKLDGTNIRVMWDGNKVSIGGKTENSQIPVPLTNKLVELFVGEPNEQKFEEIFGGDGNICLYGEGVGPKIQVGGGKFERTDFVLFDIKIGSKWLSRAEIETIASRLGITYAPIVFIGSLKEISGLAEKGFKSKWGDFTSEGIVARPACELTNSDGERIITKIKYKDFLKLNK